MIIFKGRLLNNLAIESRTSSCQCRSLHGFQTSHFRLQSIQNYASHCHCQTSFPSFAHRHVKSLYWADALFLDSWVTARRFRSALCSEVLIRNILIWSYPQCLLRDQWIIERLSKAMSATLIISCQFHRKFHFIWKKSDSSVSSRSKDQQPLELRLKLKLCSLTNGLSMSKSQNKLSGVSMF